MHVVRKLHEPEETKEVAIPVVVGPLSESAKGVLETRDQSVLMVEKNPIAEVIHPFGLVGADVLRS